MLDWFKTNSSALQAIAGVLMFGTTCVLAYLTGRYVKLTKTIATAAQNQTAALHAAELRRNDDARLALHRLAGRIDSILLLLSNDNVNGGELRRFAGVSATDVLELERLARGLGEEISHSVMVIGVSLSSLLGFIERYQSVAATMGYHVTEPELIDYRDAIKVSKEELANVVRLTEAPVRPGA